MNKKRHLFLECTRQTDLYELRKLRYTTATTSFFAVANASHPLLRKAKGLHEDDFGVMLAQVLALAPA